MATDLANNSKHWRARADEMRARAAQASDEISREMMLRIAEDYVRLAVRAELRGGPPDRDKA
jgi:hypothetical protein